MLVHINGRLIEEGEAVLSVFDRGFLFGDGIFESMRAVSGTIFRLELHLQRLRRSAERVGIALPSSEEGLAASTAALLRANRLREARLRITVTRGPGRPGELVETSGPPSVIMMAAPFVALEPRRYEEGVAVAVSPRPQIPAASLDPAIKSISRLVSVLARREARDAGAFEAIMADAEGHLTEGTVSNLFVAVDGALRTPATPAGCLPGIMRQAILDLARSLGIAVSEERLPAGILESAQEVFLTNSSWEVLPVTRVDRRAVGAGRPGPLTRRLRDAYRALLSAECSGA